MTVGLHNALLIHNPRAGSGGRRRSLEDARRILAAGGIETELADTGAPGHATELAQNAGASGREMVIVCGGDGTLNEVVNGLAASPNGHRVPLALLPGGTANVLAKELGLPWEIPRAAEKLLQGNVREIAVGLATPLQQPEKRRYFVSVAGAGPDGRIVYSLDLGLKARVGILAYWWEGVRQVVRYSFPRFRVVTPEQQMEGTLLLVGRTKHYGGPFRITTGADLLEDRFEIGVLTSQSALRYLSYLPSLYFGKLRGAEGVSFWKTDRVVCEPLGEEPVHAQVDGEKLARLPVEFRIVPKGLKLLMPRNGKPSAA
ncbi:MAG TPA: diacylglycerol kinase family protein [Methylomirabilota bacterium]|nr:diacylglycerol kinase family protein [Methylomirabilota bacterium]